MRIESNYNREGRVSKESLRLLFFSVQPFLLLFPCTIQRAIFFVITSETLQFITDLFGFVVKDHQLSSMKWKHRTSSQKPWPPSSTPTHKAEDELALPNDASNVRLVSWTSFSSDWLRRRSDTPSCPHWLAASSLLLHHRQELGEGGALALMRMMYPVCN